MTVCKDVHTGCALGKPPVAPPPTSTIMQHTAPSKPGANPNPQSHKPACKCEICDRLGGVGADTHTKEWCYCNPASKLYKAEVHERRLNQAKAKGIDIPRELQLPGKRSGGQNLIGQLGELAAQVDPTPEVQEQLIDQLLCYQQE